MTLTPLDRARTRWGAAVAAAALVLGALVATPAFADDQPTTDDVITSTATPTAEPTSQPSPEPSAEPIEVVEEAPAGETAPESLERGFAPLAVAEEPTITVSPATNLDRAGATVTVTGANYDPTKAIYVAVCEDRELSTVTFSMFYTCVGARQVSPTPSSATVVQMGTDGTFSFSFAVPASAAAMTAPAVFTIRNHVDMADRTQDAKAAISFAALLPAITVTPATNLDRAGATVTVTGANYDPTKAIYVAVCEDRDLATVTFSMFYTCVGARQVSPTPSSGTVVQMGTDGTFSFSFAVPASAAAMTAPAVFTIRNHVDMADRTQDAKASVAFAAVVDPGTPTTPTNPTNPTTPTTPAAPSVGLAVSPSSANPAVATSFTITGSGYTGAGAASGVYVSIGSSSVWQPGQVPSSGGWINTVWVQPSVVNGRFSTTITVPAGSFVGGQSYGVATFAAHGLSITDRTLDAWSPISLTSASTAAVVTTAVREPAATPPAKTGISTTEAQHTEGGTHTFTAGGYQPNESGILIVIYSTPTVLDRNATADANGVVTWTGVLPRGLTGDHTLTFQGSVSKGLALTIAAAEQAGCPVADASLTWGFKESFRSYISGSIANGEWTVADGATYETPSFGWAAGEGSYDGTTGEGLVAFLGSIRFTGHGGVLDTTVANPELKFVDADTAVLTLDVSGTTQDGATVDTQDVEFVTIDLSGAIEEADGVITATDAPTTLTAAGAEAFGTYPEGEPFDPVSFTFSVPADCAAAVEPSDSATVTAEPASSGAGLGWLWIVIGVVLLLALAAVVVIVVRRRTAA